MVPNFGFFGLPDVFQDGSFWRVTGIVTSLPIASSCLTIWRFLLNIGSRIGDGLTEGEIEGETDGLALAE